MATILRGSDNLDSALALQEDGSGNLSLSGNLDAGELQVGGSQLYYPVALAYGVVNTGAVSGWKTLQLGAQGIPLGSEHFANNNERFVAPKTGWYHITMGHGHGNGFHSQYYTRVMPSTGSQVIEQGIYGDRSVISGMMYLNAGEYVYCQVYHSNSSHPCQNTYREYIWVHYMDGVA